MLLENTDKYIGCHDEASCHETYCTLHNRSNHSMRSFPQEWRGDILLMERICPHGIGHPDPDDHVLINYPDMGIHGCDGCCHD